MGRPAKTRKSSNVRSALYKDEYAQMLIDHMANGNSFSSFCSTINVAHATGLRWIQTIDEFFEAKRIADTKYEVWWEKAGIAGMMGKVKGFNATAWVFAMKNRFNWTDKIEAVEHREKKRIQTMTDAEILEAVKKRLEGDKR